MIKSGAIFKNGMILQQNSLVSIFGETDCERVDISFCGERYEAKISGRNWIAHIPTGEANVDKPLSMVIQGVGKSALEESSTEEIVIDNILLGEVWLAGGQSNMELELQNSENAVKVMQEADYEYIRFYNVPKYPSVDDGLISLEENTSWRCVRNGSCADMSAVAYYFATKLYEKLKVPIGIIDCYWGGTSATCWVDEESLTEVSEVKGYIEDWQSVCEGKSDEVYDSELNEYNQRVNKWQKTVDKLKIDNPGLEAGVINQMAGDYPWPPPRGRKSPFRPYGLHESMVKRVAPYTVKGAIYYQGEEDGERASYYSKLNSAVIRKWRNDFDNPQMPFYITQLPMFIGADAEDDGQWGILRLEQEKCTRLYDNVGIAVIIDCGEYDNIHPIDKKTPGFRLANQVLANTYKIDDAYINLHAVSARFAGNECEITLENTYGQLCYRVSDGKNLTAKCEDIILENGMINNNMLFGFEVDNQDGEVYLPDIEIEADRIKLIGKCEDELVCAKYAMFNYGVANVYSKYGVPLMPFVFAK